MRKTFLILAAVANLGWLSVLAYVILTDGVGDAKGWWVLLLIVATIGINLLALLRSWSFDSDSWLGLWLKRKRLEERKRIKDLESP